MLKTQSLVWLASLVVLTPACKTSDAKLGGGQGGGGEGGAAGPDGGGAGTGGVTGVGGGSSSGGSGGGGGAGGGGLGGFGGAPPAECDPAAPSWAGPLCGPPEAPCQLAVSEALPTTIGYRNDAPAVAVAPGCIPHVLFARAENGYHGYLSRRSKQAGWEVEPTPFELAAGALLFDGETPLAVPDDGGFGVSLWARAAGAWSLVEKIPGEHHAGARSSRRDDASGSVHAALVSSASELVLAERTDAGWSLSKHGSATSVVALALGPEGDPHVLFWDSPQASWSLFWLAPPGDPEAVATISGSLGFPEQAHQILAPAPTGAPQVLFARPVPGDVARREIVVATREAPSVWSIEVVDQESPAPKKCDFEPTSEGEVCQYDYEAVMPLAIASSAGGDVRFFYSRVKRTGTLAASCTKGEPGELCEWTTESASVTGGLRMGWVAPGGQVGTAPVADGVDAWSGSAAVDAAGAIHVAVYDVVGDSFGVRYLRLLAGEP